MGKFSYKQNVLVTEPDGTTRVEARTGHVEVTADGRVIGGTVRLRDNEVLDSTDDVMFTPEK